MKILGKLLKIIEEMVLILGKLMKILRKLV